MGLAFTYSAEDVSTFSPRATALDVPVGSVEEQMAVENLDVLAFLDDFDIGDTEGHEWTVANRQISTASSTSLGDIFGNDPSHADMASLEPRVKPTAATLPEPSAACRMQSNLSDLHMAIPPAPLDSRIGCVRDQQTPVAQLSRPITIEDNLARSSDCGFILSDKQRQLHAAWPAKKKRRVRPGWHFVYRNKSTTAKKRKRANGKFETVELRRLRIGGDW
jgi:hypothetical protein